MFSAFAQKKKYKEKSKEIRQSLYYLPLYMYMFILCVYTTYYYNISRFQHQKLATRTEYPELRKYSLLYPFGGIYNKLS